MTPLFDKASALLALLTALAFGICLALVFFLAPVEATMGIVQKIFYMHVPAAMAAYAGFVICSVSSLIYLIRPHARWDAAAQSGAEVGVLFCLYVLISGPLWAYKAWGKAWVWEPQLTATFVLFLLYGGYVLLRSLSADSRQIRTISAGLALFALVDIPIVHYAVRGLHPKVEREGGGGLDPDMKIAFNVAMIAFLLLFSLLFLLAHRLRLLDHQSRALSLELQDLTHGAP